MAQQDAPPEFPVVKLSTIDGGLSGFMNEIGIKWATGSKQWSCRFDLGVMVTMWGHLLQPIPGNLGVYEYRIYPTDAPDDNNMKKILLDIQHAVDNRLRIFGVVIVPKPTVDIPAVGVMIPREGYVRGDGTRGGVCTTRFAKCDHPVQNPDQSVVLTVRAITGAAQLQAAIQVLA